MDVAKGLLELAMPSPVRINGLGIAAPDTVCSSQDGLEIARAAETPLDRDELAKLYSDVRIDSRSLLFGSRALQERIIEPVRQGGASTSQRLEHYRPAALALASRSAHAALASAQVDPERITHLVTVSCTGAESPGVWRGLHDELELPNDVARANIGFMGCHGALNGLAVARAFAAENPSNVVLLVCVEICSIHYHVAAPLRDQAVANAIFADGAASAVVSRDHHGPVLDCFTSRLFPGTSDLMTWRIGDRGFEMRLSPRVPIVLKRSVSEWITTWLGERGLCIGDIGSWAIHPGGRDILEGVRRGLGLSEQLLAPSLGVLAEQGNMSSSTVLWILKKLLDGGGRLPTVAMAFGPGLVGEGVLLTDR